jgi:hypothetical protein
MSYQIRKLFSLLLLVGAIAIFALTEILHHSRKGVAERAKM